MGNGEPTDGEGEPTDGEGEPTRTEKVNRNLEKVNRDMGKVNRRDDVIRNTKPLKEPIVSSDIINAISTELNVPIPIIKQIFRE